MSQQPTSRKDGLLEAERGEKRGENRGRIVEQNRGQGI
jgi:hypothetical protein